MVPMMRAEGLEPPRAFAHRHLKPACLPFHHARDALTWDCEAQRARTLRKLPRPPVLRGKVPAVAQVRNVRPGYAVIHPNRDRATCKITKLVIIAILIGSVALMLIVTIGGWSKLEGMKPVNFIWMFLYVVVAYYIARWARGLLPIAAALGILLLIIAAIATLGLAGTSWFERGSYGFGPARSLFGGGGLSPSMLGTLTLLLIPVELALIVVSMVGFSQGWNVETEVPIEEARRRGSKPIATGPDTAEA
jgi:hypothetical protein